MPKSVLIATRVIKVTQTTKKYGRDTIVENQDIFPGAIRIFQTCQFFSPIDGPTMARRWAVHGKAFFGSKLYSWMAHGISVRVYMMDFCLFDSGISPFS